jgi:hypothetical protein
MFSVEIYPPCLHKDVMKLRPTLHLDTAVNPLKDTGCYIYRLFYRRGFCISATSCVYISFDSQDKRRILFPQTDRYSWRRRNVFCQVGPGLIYYIDRFMCRYCGRVCGHEFVWICGLQIDTGASFLRVLRFPLPIFIPYSSTIRGWYNRPISGRRTKWTQSHLTPRNKKKLQCWFSLTLIICRW